LIARGEKTERMMAELFGKKTGLMKGKGGSMHFVNFDLGDFGIDSMIGTGTVIAPGIALSAKLRGTDQVCLCFFGDGIVNTERFHTGVNLASAWKLPVVFICENNIWAESTNIYDVTNLTKLTDRAVAYGIPGVAIDGNDVIAVYEAVTEAVSRARKGEGPTFIECRTCRLRGHFEGDSQTYRTKEEIEEGKKLDPIPRFRKKLIEMGVLTEKEAAKIRQEAIEEMEKALKFAQESPFPEPEELFTDVFYVEEAKK
jgi:pyruvate dehydrogenase E1 component alpha subunit